MRIVVVALPWVFMTLGIVVFFGGVQDAGAILVGSSFIAIAILRLQPPSPPAV
jgi:hypothetical protein